MISSKLQVHMFEQVNVWIKAVHSSSYPQHGIAWALHEAVAPRGIDQGRCEGEFVRRGQKRRHGGSEKEVPTLTSAVRDVLLQDVAHRGHVEAVPAHGRVDDGLEVLRDRVRLHQHLAVSRPL